MSKQEIRALLAREVPAFKARAVMVTQGSVTIWRMTKV